MAYGLRFGDVAGLPPLPLGSVRVTNMLLTPARLAAATTCKTCSNGASSGAVIETANGSGHRLLTWLRCHSFRPAK